MTPQEFAAYAVHYLRDVLDFATDQIGGGCICEDECARGNVELGLEQLDHLKRHLTEEANKVALENGVSMNVYPDGTPVKVEHHDGNYNFAHVRKPGDPTDPQVLFAGHLRPKLEVVK